METIQKFPYDNSQLLCIVFLSPNFNSSLPLYLSFYHCVFLPSSLILVFIQIITKASADGTLLTRNWDTEPLFPLPKTTLQNSEKYFLQPRLVFFSHSYYFGINIISING